VRAVRGALLVFVASGAVLVLEILGIRLLAPYVGLTIETTTVIIGTVLAGIAAGAALGGRAADQLDERRLLAGLLAVDTQQPVDRRADHRDARAEGDCEDRPGCATPHGQPVKRPFTKDR
jgi:hypothetical protein